MEYDVVVVGGGPAGLACAIRCKQIAQMDGGKDISVVVLEKGSEPGAHILSGAVMDPRAITELFPNWKELGAPLKQRVKNDEVLFLTERDAKRTPNWLIPDCLHNDGNYVISLGEVTQVAGRAGRGPGRRNLPRLHRRRSAVRRRRRRARRGHRQPGHRQGRRSRTKAFSSAWSCAGKYTVFAEGARGHLGKQLINALSASTAGATRRATPSASRNCGKCRPTKPSPASWCTPPAGRWTTTPTAAASSTTWKTTRSRSASSPGSTTRTRGSARSRRCSAGRRTPHPRAHRRRQAHRLRRARHHRGWPAVACPSWCFPAARWSAATPAPQRRAHQGQPCRDQDRHAVRRGGLRSGAAERVAATTN